MTLKALTIIGDTLIFAHSQFSEILLDVLAHKLSENIARISS